MSAYVERRKKPRRIRKIILWVLVLGLAAAVVYRFVLPTLAAQATTTYEKYTAVIGTISNSMNFSGSVSVKNNETFVAEAEGTVRQILVEEEQQVKTGDKLMRLSGGETVKANFDGKVNQIFVEKGDSISEGDSLIQVVDFNNMKISLRVDEYGISKLQVDQACTVTVTALDLTFDSKITHINRIGSSSMGSTAYYTVTAEIAVTDDVLPGMQATVVIPEEEAVDAVILNKSALSYDRRNNAYVMMYDTAGELQQVAVELGVDNDNYVQIVSGVEEGDEVYAELAPSADGSAGGFAMFNMGGAAPAMDMQQSGGNAQYRGGGQGTGFTSQGGGFSGPPER